MVYRIIIVTTILVLIASIVHFASVLLAQPASNQMKIIIANNKSIDEKNTSHFNETTDISHVNVFDPIGNQAERINSISYMQDKVTTYQTKSTMPSSSSSRILHGWAGGFMSARDIDNLNRARDININVLSNINVADIIRAYRGEPKPTESNGSRRSGSWFWW